MALDEMLARKGSSISMMLAMEVEDGELIRRLLYRGKESGRPDDQNELVIGRRIGEYNAKTAPLKNYYTAQGKFYSINGIGSIENIFDRLCQVING